MEERLEQTVKQLPPSKRPKKNWEQQKRDLLNALADANLSVSEAARTLFMHRNTVVYHIEKMRKEGHDPLNFYQLAEMLGYVKQEAADAEKI